MDDITINDLQTKVKVIHFGTNRFVIIATSYRLSIVTYALGRAVYHNT